MSMAIPPHMIGAAKPNAQAPKATITPMHALMTATVRM